MPFMRRLYGWRRFLLYLAPALVLGAASFFVSPLAALWFSAFVVIGPGALQTALPALALLAGIAAFLGGPYAFFVQGAASRLFGPRDLWSLKTCRFCGRGYFISEKVHWENDRFCSWPCLALGRVAKEWKGPALPGPLFNLILVLRISAIIGAAAAVVVIFGPPSAMESGYRVAAKSFASAGLCGVVLLWLAAGGLHALKKTWWKACTAGAAVSTAAGCAGIFFLRYPIVSGRAAALVFDPSYSQASLGVLRLGLLLWVIFAAWAFYYLLTGADGLFVPEGAARGAPEP